MGLELLLDGGEERVEIKEEDHALKYTEQKAMCQGKLCGSVPARRFRRSRDRGLLGI